MRSNHRSDTILLSNGSRISRPCLEIFSRFWPTCWPGFCAALYAEVLARCRNAPSTPFFITAAIPLIPGSTLYYCMNAVVSNDLPAAEHFGEQTFLAALGIAGGMAIAWCLADLSRKLQGRL